MLLLFILVITSPSLSFKANASDPLKKIELSKELIHLTSLHYILERRYVIRLIQIDLSGCEIITEKIVITQSLIPLNRPQWLLKSDYLEYGQVRISLDGGVSWKAIRGNQVNNFI